MMRRVDSSTISHIGYDEEKQELHVDFHGTGRYIYHNVSKATYQAFLKSPSKGKFLHENIKGVHEHSKGKR